MSKKRSEGVWRYISLAGIIIPVLMVFLAAVLNGTERSAIIRDWGVLMVAVIAIYIPVSVVSLFKLHGTWKIAGVMAVLIGLAAGYAVLYSYSFSFYGA